MKLNIFSACVALATLSAGEAITANLTDCNRMASERAATGPHLKP